MSNFLKLLSVDVRQHVYEVEGCSYIPAWRAHGMAGFPQHEAVVFTTQHGLPVLCRRMFGGTAVAMDMDVGSNGLKQRIYLPLLDLKGKPIPAGSETARDVSDTSARCLARAIAIVHGLGLCLYSKMAPGEFGDGAKYAEYLQVSPDVVNLSRVQPLVDMKEIKDKRTGRVTRRTPYLGWHSAVAAARITDPDFVWEVMEFKAVDPDSGEIVELPAMKLEGKGWLVGVKLHYKGSIHTHYLPIMGVQKVMTRNGEKPMEHQPLDTPTVFQWHSAVMRCLAKAIATSTGYGISLYAKGDVDPFYLEDDSPLVPEEATQEPRQERQQERQQRGRGTPEEAQEQYRQNRIQVIQKRREEQAARLQQQAGQQQNGEEREIIVQIRQLLDDTSSDESVFISWLGVENLSHAPDDVLEHGYSALLTKQRSMNAATRRAHN